VTEGAEILSMTVNILIVDDSERVRNSLHTWLKSAFPSWSIEEAGCGQQAVDCVLAHPPGLILMDISMPGINGIEATRKIRVVAPETKVVMLTAYEDTQYRTDASMAGASAYVIKRKMHTELIPVLINLLALKSP
jgi:DNA-binding NarL/FixJ family response regulator